MEPAQTWLNQALSKLFWHHSCPCCLLEDTPETSWGPFQPDFSHEFFPYLPQCVMPLDFDVILASGRYYYGVTHRVVWIDSVNKPLYLPIFKVPTCHRFSLLLGRGNTNNFENTINLILQFFNTISEARCLKSNLCIKCSVFIQILPFTSPQNKIMNCSY